MANIGIEIENESRQLSLREVTALLRASSRWIVVPETSLRGRRCWEIKTAGNRGLPFEEVISSLSELYPALVNSSGIWRAAVHTHVDVANLSNSQRALVLALSYIFDDSIFELISPERRESNFCAPLLRKQEAVLAAINTWIVSTDRSICPGYGKYSSVNIDSYRAFGSFEYRHMKTPRTSNTVKSVARAVDLISQFATIAHLFVDVVTPLTVGPKTFTQQLERLLSDTSTWDRVGLEPRMDCFLDLVQNIKKTPAPKKLIASLDSLSEASLRGSRPATGRPEGTSFRDYLIGRAARGGWRPLMEPDMYRSVLQERLSRGYPASERPNATLWAVSASTGAS